MTKPERLAKLLLLLQDKPRSSSELADALEVARRTIMRDVQALLEMGVPVLSRDGIGGGYSLASHFTLQPLELDGREAMLLLLALDGLERLSDTPFNAARATLAAKVRSLIPDAQRERTQWRLRNVQLDAPKREQKAPYLDALIDSAGSWVEVVYDGEDGPCKRVCLVERVHADAGLWYADVVETTGRKVLRADRVLRIEPCAQPKELPDHKHYDDPAHPEIVVVLSRAGLRKLERDRHLGHLAVGLSEPARLAFRCPPSELAWYARFFGGQAEDAVVEGPPELIELIVSMARAQLALYAPKSS